MLSIPFSNGFKELIGAVSMQILHSDGALKPFSSLHKSSSSLEKPVVDVKTSIIKRRVFAY